MLLSGQSLFKVSAGGETFGSPDVSAKSAILIEATTGRILFAKNEKQRLPMASTTKIISALIALETENIDERFEVDRNAIMVEGSSMGLKEGDKVSLRDLAYGMLLPSGNDAANAAAVAIAGSIPEFAKLMNKRAQMLGLKDTHFETPSGLDSKEHYSTAYDMSMIARVALQNPDFREICSKSSAKIEAEDSPNAWYMTNHNKLLKQYEGTIGLKTGFTKKSGRCLVSAAQRDGVTLIAVTLNAPNDWQDHTKMLDYGFSSVKPIDLDVDVSDVEIKVVGGKQSTLEVIPSEFPKVCITQEELPKLKRKVLISRFYYAPVEAGSVVGEVQYFLGNDKIVSVGLLAQTNVERNITEVKFTIFERIKMFFTNIYYKICGILQKIF
jgi:D-alanyl-D-alanine carboxypeptidase/D-alanyl-D-alanine carboxypeptidase (penicillin-binding protein 5/6)